MLAIPNFFTAINKSAFPNKQKQTSFPSLMNPWREVWILHLKCALLRLPIFKWCGVFFFFSPLTYCSVQQHKNFACFPSLNSSVASLSLCEITSRAQGAPRHLKAEQRAQLKAVGKRPSGDRPCALLV